MQNYNIEYVIEGFKKELDNIYEEYSHKIINQAMNLEDKLRKEKIELDKIIEKCPKEKREYYFSQMDIRYIKSLQSLKNELQNLMVICNKKLNRKGRSFVNRYFIESFDDRELISKYIWSVQDKLEEYTKIQYYNVYNYIESTQRSIAQFCWREEGIEDGFSLFFELIQKAQNPLLKQIEDLYKAYELELKSVFNKEIDDITSEMIDKLEWYKNRQYIIKGMRDKSYDENSIGLEKNKVVNEFENELNKYIDEKTSDFIYHCNLVEEKFKLNIERSRIIKHNIFTKLESYISYIKEFLIWELKDELIAQINIVKKEIEKDIIDKSLNQKKDKDESTYIDNNNVDIVFNEFKKYNISYISSYKELVKLAIKRGFREKRIRGSHCIFENQEGRIVVIPQHTIGKGLSFHIQKCIYNT